MVVLQQNCCYHLAAQNNTSSKLDRLQHGSWWHQQRRSRQLAAPRADGGGRIAGATALIPPSAVASRSSLLRSLAAIATLCAGNSSLPHAASATSASDAAEAAVAATQRSVVAVAGIASGLKGAALGLQQLGSGLVWDELGHIVTCYGPLTRLQRQGTAGDPQVFVSLQGADGSVVELPAAILAKDPSRDLAVLQVEPPPGGLQPVTLGASAGLRVGQDAILVGCLPSGGPVVAAGVVSAVGRAIPASNNQAIAGVLQTDADVTAQTLGGALLDSSGRLVGMPVVSYSSKASARSSGVNFALPADMLREVVPQLIVYGSAAVRR